MAILRTSYSHAEGYVGTNWPSNTVYYTLDWISLWLWYQGGCKPWNHSHRPFSLQESGLRCVCINTATTRMINLWSHNQHTVHTNITRSIIWTRVTTKHLSQTKLFRHRIWEITVYCLQMCMEIVIQCKMHQIGEIGIRRNYCIAPISPSLHKVRYLHA